jgi:hypothetical protein
MIVADMTRIIVGSEQRFIAVLPERLRMQGTTVLIIVAHRHQKSAVPMDLTTDVRFVEDFWSPEQIGDYIRREILLPSLRDSQAPIEVLSLHPAVLDVPLAMPSTVRPRIAGEHWFKLVGPSSPQANAVGGWTDHSITLFVRALAGFPRGLRQNALREILVGVSDEFEKTTTGASMTTLVRMAQRRGLVVVTADGGPNPHVTVSDNGRLHIASSGQPELEKVQSHTPQTGHPNALRGEEEKTVARNEGAPRASQAANSFPPNIQVASGAVQKERKRSEVLYDRFKDAKFGPYSRHRQRFYDEIDKLVRAGKFSASFIVKKVARTVLSDPKENGTKKKPPFQIVEAFLFELLGRCPVLLDSESKPCNPNRGESFSKPVVDLVPEWRDFLEAEMILHLAVTDTDLSSRETDVIGFVLFPTLDEDGRIQKVESLLNVLEDSGRIRVEDGHKIRPSGKEFDPGEAKKVLVTSFNTRPTVEGGSESNLASAVS